MTPCLWLGSAGSPRHTSLGVPPVLKNIWSQSGGLSPHLFQTCVFPWFTWILVSPEVDFH